MVRLLRPQAGGELLHAGAAVGRAQVRDVPGDARDEEGEAGVLEVGAALAAPAGAREWGEGRVQGQLRRRVREASNVGSFPRVQAGYSAAQQGARLPGARHWWSMFTTPPKPSEAKKGVRKTVRRNAMRPHRLRSVDSVAGCTVWSIRACSLRGESVGCVRP